MAKWTDDDLPDLSGRTYVVTGATSGLGLQTATALAAHGAQVVLTGRDPDRLGRSVAEVAATATGPDPVGQLLDLADLGSVRAAAEELIAAHPTIHVLINNAGVMAPPRGTTVDGFELQIGTNHLGHYALTGLLLPALPVADATADARVVTVASGAHRMGDVDPDDLNFERRSYQPWRAYGQSKSANLLFTAELDHRAHAAHAHLVAAAAHPGWAATNLQFAGPSLAQNRIGRTLTSGANLLMGQSARAGAWPTLYAATESDVRGDDYIGPDGLFEQRGHPRHVGRNSAASDPDTARRLWEVSEELTGVVYVWPTA
ncbi:MAG: oxidoreductase [Candidatus Nanopelagicales bacterium]